MQSLVLISLIAFAITPIAQFSRSEDADTRHVITHRHGEECNSNSTRGLYLPFHDLGHTRCCKGKELVPPSIWVNKNWTDESGEERFYATFQYSLLLDLPYMKICGENTAFNDNDDLPTLMAKVQACIDEKFIGKPGKEINFKTFVAYKMMNYTNDTAIQKTILDANKKCTEGDKQTEIHLKLSEYFWCFHRNEAEVCDKPLSEQAKEIAESRRQELNSTKIKETCPQITKSVVELSYCCRGKPTSVDWTTWPTGEFYDYAFTNRSPAQEIQKKRQQCFSSFDRFRRDYETREMENGKNQTEEGANSTHYFPTACMHSCIINPVIFSNGTNGPEIDDWKSDEYLNTFYNSSKNLNAKIRTELIGLAVKLKSEMRFPLTSEDVTNKITRKTLKEIEKMYAETTNAITRMALYCAYYDKLRDIHGAAIAKYCGVEFDFEELFEDLL